MKPARSGDTRRRASRSCPRSGFPIRISPSWRGTTTNGWTARAIRTGSGSTRSRWGRESSRWRTHSTRWCPTAPTGTACPWWRRWGRSGPASTAITIRTSGGCFSSPCAPILTATRRRRPCAPGSGKTAPARMRSRFWTGRSRTCAEGNGLPAGAGQERPEGRQSPMEMLPPVRLQGEDGGSAGIDRRLQDSQEIDGPLSHGKMVVPAAAVVVEVQFAQVRAERLQPLVDGKLREKGGVAGVEAESQPLRPEGVLHAEQVIGRLVEDVFEEEIDPLLLRVLEGFPERPERGLEPFVGFEIEDPAVVPPVHDDSLRTEDGSEGDRLPQSSHRVPACFLVARSGPEVFEGGVEGGAGDSDCRQGGRRGLGAPGRKGVEHGRGEIDLWPHAVLREETDGLRILQHGIGDRCVDGPARGLHQQTISDCAIRGNTLRASWKVLDIRVYTAYIMRQNRCSRGQGCWK